MARQVVRYRIAALAILAVAAVADAAESKPPVLPEVTVVPEIDFAKHPPLGAPSISPSGLHIALAVHNTENGEDKYQLAVLHLPDLKFVSRLEMAAHYLPVQITWVDDRRLVMGTAEQTGFAEAPLPTGDVIAVDFDGANKKVLYSDMLRDSISAQRTILKMPPGGGSITGRPDKPNGHFYLTVNPAPESSASGAQANKTLIYDVDSRTGNSEEMASISQDGYRFLIKDGVVHYAYGADNKDKEHIYFRAAKDQPWTELAAAVVGRRMEPRQMSPDNQHLYSVGNPDGGPDQLAISNLDGTDRKVLASNPRVSVDDVFWTPVPRTPYAVSFAEGRPTITYLDTNKYAAALKSLNTQFSDHYVAFRGMSVDGATMLVAAVSDRDPGTFALFDSNSNNLRPLYQLLPWMKADKLGERRPFWFKASSGTELGGFITLPPNRSAKNLPTILLPHGGPIGPDHSWAIGGWDDTEAQFLATRGYAVVQVNYRGSGGRGKAFEDSGKREVGTGMMQDMLDGLKWAEEQGYSDPQRICVYGASYGGYAAYFQPVYAPQGTFKCSVAIAGVSDIRVQNERSDIRRSRAGNNFLGEAWGMGDEAYLTANSAIDHVDKFNVPVLIIHGEDDRRVPVQNAREMRDALEKAGKPVEYMTRPKEGHGFFKEENNVDRYKITEAFLDKYLGPGAPAK